MINLPFSGSIDDFRPAELPTELGHRAIVYDAEIQVGFPISFHHVTKKANNYNLFAHAANIAIATVNLIALVYCAQAFFGQFSLRTILGFVALVSLLIAIGQVIFTIERGNGSLMYVATIFFSPLIGIVPAFILNFYRSK